MQRRRAETGGQAKTADQEGKQTTLEHGESHQGDERHRRGERTRRSEGEEGQGGGTREDEGRARALADTEVQIVGNALAAGEQQSRPRHGASEDVGTEPAPESPPLEVGALDLGMKPNGVPGVRQAKPEVDVLDRRTAKARVEPADAPNAERRTAPQPAQNVRASRRPRWWVKWWTRFL